MADLDPVFLALKKLLSPYQRKMVLVHDTDAYYYLDTSYMMPNKKPMFFGAVRRGAKYVSFYLMPVYCYPELLASMSTDLKKRMQGKSCFNFTSVDATLFAELAALTKAGAARFQAEGYVS